MANLDIPPYCTAQGDRAKLRGLNMVGLRRGGFSRETISQIKNAYKTLFLEGLRLDEAVRKMENQNPGPEVREFSEFVRRSKRGITRPSLALEEVEVG